MTVLMRCPSKTNDGRRCMLSAGHPERKPHRYAGIVGEQCTCILRVYPNRCTAHPENNQ